MSIAPEHKFEAMISKIQAKNDKKNKVLHNPFHSHDK